ncbi:thiosulfate oxidation carrier protein SoxY [Pseudophaeobacter leonis]|uniref:thiosulfate oxidation carrier protein SoxY n=1 Tax=Pseudophaeobacter leonis TaxID=1144477 RepID=UPI001F4E0B26|nr:thiosulfate oxidation carrier protein SoxY [Pseudophaeobacter leonis]
MKKPVLTALLLGSVLASAASAFEPSWSDLRHALYEDQTLTEAGDLIQIDAPYRSALDARTNIGARIMAPDGRMLQSVTVILDENPMPVSAGFTFAQPMAQFDFDVTMRVNGPTPLHMVARTTEGQLLAKTGFVKTSGQGACAAPPGTDPELALATLGQMEIAFSNAASTSSTQPASLPASMAASLPASLSSLSSFATSPGPQLQLDIQHPSHSGMQMDQISLLYLPARYIETVAVDPDGVRFVDVTGRSR